MSHIERYRVVMDFKPVDRFTAMATLRNLHVLWNLQPNATVLDHSTWHTSRSDCALTAYWTNSFLAYHGFNSSPAIVLNSCSGG